jgi:hypothetical protein
MDFSNILCAATLADSPVQESLPGGIFCAKDAADALSQSPREFGGGRCNDFGR